jgi:peptidoglycan/LPS O-acetylase OafA/YrhL
MLSISGWLASPLFALAAGAAIANLTQLKLHQRLRDSRAEPFVSWGLLAGALVFAALRPEILEPVWLTLCSSALLYGVLLNGSAQRALSTPISQWLGRISFSLYLLHILVICSFTSWGYLALSQEGVLSNASTTLILGATVILCLSAATFFYPLERLGIALGRSFSKAVLRTN